MSPLRSLLRKNRPGAKRADSNLAVAQVRSARGIRRFPTMSQWRHLPDLLNQTEQRLFAVGLLLVLVSGGWLGWRLWNGQRLEVPAVGGEYTEGVVGQPQLINPLYSLTSDVDLDLTHLIYSGLMRFDAQDGLSTDLAESYSISEDQKEYTVVLRDDAYWHDGQRVNTDDVLFTIAAIQNKEYRSPLSVSFSGVSVEQVDDRTVKFTLTEPFAPFLSLLTVGLLPSHIWQELSPLNAPLTEYNKKPVGSGPYKFEKLTKDARGNIKSYTLKRFDRYYRGAPYLDQLVFKFYGETDSAVDALKNHQIEGLGYLPLKHVPELTHANDLDLIFPVLPQYTAVFFNQKRQVALADPKVRTALTLATNKNSIVSNALLGHAQVADSFLLPGSLGYDANLAKIAFDQAAAKAKLDEAGWLLPEGGLTRKKGENELVLDLVTINSPELTAVAEQLRVQWTAVGVHVNVRPVDQTEFQNEVLKNRSYDAILSGELYGIDPDPYTFWHSSQSTYPGLNLANFGTRKADDAIEAARKTTDPVKRTEYYQTLQNEVLAAQPAIFLYQPSYPYALSKKIQGENIERIVVPADRLSNINEWYVKTRRILSPAK